MLWRVSRPVRSRSKPDGFILPCQPALADRPPSGPGWLHEIKFDGYRVTRFPPGPITFQARRLYPAVPAGAGGQAAVRPGLAARDQVRRIPRDRP